MKRIFKAGGIRGGGIGEEGLADLKRQFRLGALEQEIGELLKSP